MGVIGIGVGDAIMGRTRRDENGNIMEQSAARWDANPPAVRWRSGQWTRRRWNRAGRRKCTGTGDAARYLARVVDLIHPNRQINIPDLEAMIRAAAKDGVDICTYCPDYNCRDCIVNEWKEDADDEQDEN